MILLRVSDDGQKNGGGEMAWISVHEQVLGGKLRSLAKEIGCSQNEALGVLVRFWLWGIHNADKNGRIIGADKYDIAEVITIGLDGRYPPEKAVDALIATNWIDLGDGLYIHDWEEWQEQWYRAIQVRERAAARKREERKRKKLEINGSPPNARNEPDKKDIHEALPSPKLVASQEALKSNAASVYTNDFEEFWSVYPRKVGKGDAYKKYQTRLKDGWSPAELLEAAENYAGMCKAKKTERDYIKHPKTFLSDTTPFADFISKRETGSQAAGCDYDNDPFGDWR